MSQIQRNRSLADRPGRERRSHAERSEETRGKITAAVLESIADVGFERTTALEITRRAGVSWGAVQHHFGARATSGQGPMFQSWDRVWRALFADASITPRRHRVLQHYTISVLSGLATTRMLGGREASVHPEELAFLKDTLARELTRSAA